MVVVRSVNREKACRGPLEPVANEYAWGDVTVTIQTGVTGADGSGTETASPADANYWAYAGGGPMRVGIYATAGSTRQAAGASYWGIMELSGSAMEMLVGVGNAPGRLITRVHGDGKLNHSGDADVSSWPTAGAGWRGGNCYSYTTALRLAWRASATWQYTARSPDLGWRGCRTAP